MSDINDLVQIARSQIGTEEDPQHQNVGSSIKKYQDSTSLGGQGWPWCAAFVDWCVQQFAPEDAKIAHVPRTAAAFGLIDWANNNHFDVFNPPGSSGGSAPQSGDIVVYEFSHCGIVSKPGDDNHDFYAIEGNTNPGGGRDGAPARSLGKYRACRARPDGDCVKWTKGVPTDSLRAQRLERLGRWPAAR